MELVNEITTLDVIVLKKFPPILEISCEGTVPTTGWNIPELAARVYVTPPQDGMQEFDFYAEPPSGPSGQEITPIKVHLSFQTEKWCKGIRVYAEKNSKEFKI